MSSRNKFKISEEIAIDDRILPTLQTSRWKRLNAFVERHFFVIAIAVALLSAVAVLPAFAKNISGDVRLYRDVSHDLLNGQWPYRDRTLEYPPYSVPIFLLPRLVVDSEHYLVGFMILCLLADAAVKALLIRAGRVSSYGVGALGPVALYSLAVPFLQMLYLQRFDTWPAMLTIVLVMVVARRKFLTSGALLSVGVFLKLYPIVLGPALMFSAMRQRNWRRFVCGLVAGIVPVAVLSAFLPWWRFAFFQANRGLEAESIYASVIWLGKLFGWWPATWGHVIAWSEVLGPVASAVVPYARLTWVVTTFFSAILSARRLGRAPNLPPGDVARVLLPPILAFVVFNPVFSPQFMLWLLAPAALATMGRSVWASLAILFCAILTPVTHYHFGPNLGLLGTGALVLRNGILAGTWAGLVCEKLSSEIGHRKSESPQIIYTGDAAIDYEMGGR